MPNTATSSNPAPEVSQPMTASQCPHLGREYNHFAGPHLHKPQPFFARLRKQEPVTFSPTLGMWLVSRLDDINAVLNSPASYSSASKIASGDNLTAEARAILGPGPILLDSPLNTDPPVHTRLKRLLQRGFLPAQVARHEERIRQLANTLIDGFIHEGRVDLVERYAHPLPMQVILSLVGVPAQDMAQVKQWTADLLGLVFSQPSAEAQVAMVRGVVEYRAYCTRLIEQRREQPQDDLASELVHAQVEGDALTVPELVSLLGGSLIAAGHETTTAQLALSLKNLLEQPERWELLLRDRTLVPRAVEECMRYEGAAVVAMRTAVQDVEVGGVLLPKGARLLLLVNSANHDEAHYVDPERFDLRRENPHHLTLSRGIHFCLGAALARLELRVAIEQLLERLPDMRLIAGQDYGYQQEMVILRMIRRLQVEWPMG
jgi:cytochrome P450